MILHGHDASAPITARGTFPVPLTAVGNRGDCIEQLERARQRRETRAFPIHNPAPFECEETTTPSRHKRGSEHGLARFTPAGAKILADEYAAMATCAELALKYKCSESTISRTLRDRGVVIRNNGGDGGHSTEASKRRSATVAAYLSGQSPREVAARFGIHHRTVSRNVVAAGYPLRTGAETRRRNREVAA